MKKISNSSLTILFMITYLISYLTRTNYSAILVEMVADTGFSKTALSAALTGSFITYGTGQIISGFFGDRIQPKKLVFSGLLVTSAVNIIIPFCSSPWQMTLLWSINGFAQAFMWPPMVRLMVSLFDDTEYRKASVKVGYGSSLGTVAVFLLSPALISLWGWKSVFIFSAAAGIIMAFIWNMLCVDLPAEICTDKNPRNTEKSGGFKITFLFIMIMIAIVLQGSLRDGVTTWTPTYIDEIYDLGSEISILTSVVLPLFSMLCHGVGGWLYYKIFKNPLFAAGAFFGTGTVAALGIYFLTGKNAIISMICLAVLVGAMHGVNLMLICMVPSFYKSTGKISLVSGLLNSCTYIGSAVSTYGIALLTDGVGWNTTIGIWVLIAAIGTLICLTLIPSWNKSFSFK